MKTIRVKFIGFTDFDLDECDFYHILKKNYIIEESDNPDYVICSIFGRPYEYCKYDQIRIMCVGENYIPDFNVIDYAISPYPISFFDRNFYYPWCMHSYGRCKALQTKERKYDESLIKEKEFFANFIYGQVSENNIREDFFIRLSKYKRVESAGKNLNNMPNHMVVGRKNSGKIDFQKKCKFSICFESNKHKGFITEKIVDAFYADTIPIYYGSDTITTIFNKDAFINCNDYESFDRETGELIQELTHIPVNIDEKGAHMCTAMKEIREYERNEGIKEGRRFGLEEGRKAERANTAREKARADAAKARADAAEALVAELKAQIAAMK